MHLIFQQKDSEIHPRGVCCDPVFELDHSGAWLEISVWYGQPFGRVCTLTRYKMLPPQSTCTLCACDCLQTTLRWDFSRKLQWKGCLLYVICLHTACGLTDLMRQWKNSRLITWPGARCICALAFVIMLSATSALAVTIVLSAAGALAVAGALYPLDFCAFISACVQDVLVGHHCGLWTLQGLIGVPRFANTFCPTGGQG